MFIPIARSALEAPRSAPALDGADDSSGKQGRAHRRTDEFLTGDRPVTEELLGEMSRALAQRLNDLVDRLGP